MANLAKLTQLLAHISAPKTEFDMGVWVNDQDHEDAGVGLPAHLSRPFEAETPRDLVDADVCKTPHCAAGWAIALDGHPLLSLENQDDILVGTATGKTGENGLPVYSWQPIEEDQIIARARDILDISHDQAVYLFTGLSNSEDLALAYLAKLIYKETRRLAAEKAGAEYDYEEENFGAPLRKRKDWIADHIDRLNRKGNS